MRSPEKLILPLMLQPELGRADQIWSKDMLSAVYPTPTHPIRSSAIGIAGNDDRRVCVGRSLISRDGERFKALIPASCAEMIMTLAMSKAQF